MCRAYMQWGCCIGPYPTQRGFWGCCYPPSREEEIEYLKNLKDMLEKQLNEVQRKIEKIKGR